MKNKRTFLASVALGAFLIAIAAPIITLDENGQQLGIDKKSVVLKRK
ncbi:hypothetical protein [Maribacter flavus]|nr:hypothetical protein [Maribacter flavus]